MFLVFNKEKISAYIVSILTVCCLFFIASNVPSKEKSTQTSVNFQNENNTNNSLNVNNAENKGNTIIQ